MLLNMNDIIIHHRNIQTLVIELFIKNYDFAPPIMDSLSNKRTICYNFRNLQVLVGKKENCVLWFRNNKLTCTPIMDNLPEELKQRNTISFLKVMSDNGYVMSVHADYAKYL